MFGFIFNLKLPFQNLCTLTFKYEKSISFCITKNIKEVSVEVFKYSAVQNSLKKVLKIFIINHLTT